MVPNLLFSKRCVFRCRATLHFRLRFLLPRHLFLRMPKLSIELLRF